MMKDSHKSALQKMCFSNAGAPTSLGGVIDPLVVRITENKRS